LLNHSSSALIPTFRPVAALLRKLSKTAASYRTRLAHGSSQTVFGLCRMGYDARHADPALRILHYLAEKSFSSVTYDINVRGPMSDARETDEGLKNGVPIIDRMMDILDLLQHRQGGASIKDIATSLALPRSTVYRVLNTLEHHGMVRRSSGAAYLLGPRLLALAAQVVEGGHYDFAEIGRPHLERLTDATNEASKISIHGDNGILVVATAHAAHEYGLSINPGRLLPYHAGAAGKLLMAYLEPKRIDQILQRPLHAYTPQTPVDPAVLRTELATIRHQGWSSDISEYSGLVRAFAAPIRDPNGHVVAAISVPFLGDKSEEAMERIRQAVVRTAATISTSLAQNARLGRPPAG